MALSDPHWAEDFNILFKPDRMIEFWSTKDMTSNEKLNALARFTIYITVILYIYTRNRKYIYVGVIALIVNFFLRKSDKKFTENFFVNKPNVKGALPCRAPTKDNPFMNVSIGSYDRPQKYKGACNSTKKIKKEIKDIFYNDLYQPVSDVWQKNNSQRQFYTAPVNSVPNDQGAFAQWLYGQPYVCKDGDSQVCTGFEAGKGNR